jgi:hypothetical protein
MLRMESIIIVEKPIWIPTEYINRKEYLKLYQRFRYHNDEEYRQKQMAKVKSRYRINKAIQNNIKEISTQTL